MHYKEKQNREQLMMVSYDTMISQDNPVRLIDLMCKKFVSDNPLRDEWKGNKKDGRKSYPPDSMLGLLVYGYFNGISSSRKLERETYRNIEVLWLMEGLQPDHWTVCEFRRINEGLIKDFLKTFRQFLLEGSYATGDKLVFDGTKVKAYAKREMLTSKSIREKLESRYAKEKNNERKQVVEHPFGTIKWLMGKFDFLLTGKEKAQIEFDLYSTAYNIKRLINCAPTTELMAKMIKYNWAMA